MHSRPISRSLAALVLCLAYAADAQAISIRGTIWCSPDGDTDCGRDQFPGPNRVSGVELTLCDAQGAVLIDRLNGQPIVTTTDANGEYVFADLYFRVGAERMTYIVKITGGFPAGKVLGAINCLNTRFDEPVQDQGCIDSGVLWPGPGPAELDICGATSLVEMSIEIHMLEFLSWRCNTFVNGIDFVLCADNPPCTGRVGDLVWLDLDSDEVKDADELGIEGVSMVLCDAAGNPIATTATDHNGLYHFEGLCAGAYTVKIDESSVPPGFERCVGNLGQKSTTLATDASEDLTLDFCYKEPPPPCTGRMGDLVWLDMNHDGLKDAVEPGLENVRVVLCDAAGDELSDQLTDVNGAYLFEGLCAGTYAVKIDETTLRPGLQRCEDGLGQNRTSPAMSTLATDASEDLTLDFCYKEPPPPCTGRIGDLVWVDADGDGIKDADESPIAGVRMILKDAPDHVLAETETNQQGLYVFEGLCHGCYWVMVDPDTIPPGLEPCPRGLGDNRGPMADICLATDSSEDLTADFCFFEPTPPGGGEGCTPGYWKQYHHLGSWGISPHTLFSAIFEDAFPGKTLFAVVNGTGGGLNALGRHAVAAYLNAIHDDVDYDLTPADVVAIFNDAFPGSTDDYNDAKAIFEEFNEQSCPLGRAEVDSGECRRRYDSGCRRRRSSGRCR